MKHSPYLSIVLPIFILHVANAQKTAEPEPTGPKKPVTFEEITAAASEETTEAPDRPAPSTQPTSSLEVDARKVLDDHLSRIFLFKNGSVFTQKIEGDRRIPYELEAFTIVGPRELPLPTPAKRAGIERKIIFSVSVTAWRSYDRASGWTEWKPGRPLHLGGISMQRKDGTWEMLTSPAPYYTVN